jgi:hypothetical protein
VLVGERPDLAQVAGQAGEVDRNDHVRERSVAGGALELVGERGDRHVAARRIDVDEIDLRAAVERAVGRGEKAVRARPDARTRTDPECEAGDVQARGRAAHADRVRHLLPRSERLLERRTLWALRDQLRAQDPADGLDVCFGDVLPAVRNERHGSLSAPGRLRRAGG